MATVNLDDRLLKALMKKMGRTLATKEARVGILQSAGADKSHDSHPSTSPGPGAEISMLELAAIHEFGAPSAGIPARSFIRSAFEPSSSKAEQSALSQMIARKIVLGKTTPDQGLGILGSWGQSQVQKNIKAGISPKNAESTVAKKKSSKPLVDTGRMINAVTWKLEG